MKNKIVHFVDHNNSNRPYIDWTKSKPWINYYWNHKSPSYSRRTYILINKKYNEAENVIRDAIEYWKTFNSTKIQRNNFY